MRFKFGGRKARGYEERTAKAGTRTGYMCSIVIMVFFAILGGYVLTSVFFFKFPNLIHKRKQLKFKCRHISHRGGEFVMVKTRM
jgi:hypothetical protein